MSEQSLIQAARELRPLIESQADETERQCTMTSPVVEAIESTGLFRLSIPKEIGGLEANVDTIMGVCEAISFADGATGWAFTQNTITGSYLSYIHPANAKPFAAMRAGAGHFAPLGVAHEEGRGVQGFRELAICERVGAFGVHRRRRHRDARRRPGPHGCRRPTPSCRIFRARRERGHQGELGHDGFTGYRKLRL